MATCEECINVMDGNDNYVQFNNCNINHLHIGSKINFHEETKVNKLKTKLKRQLKNDFRNKSVTVVPRSRHRKEDLFTVARFIQLEIFNIKEDEKPEQVQSLKNVSNEIKNCKKIYLEGDAGHGKSVLCSKLYYEWQKGQIQNDDPFLNDFNYVFLISVKDLEGKSVLEEVCRQIIVKNNELKIDFVKDFLQEVDEECLLFIDGLEGAEDSETLLQEIFDSLPSAAFVATSRPMGNESTKIHRMFTCTLQVKGFSDENKKNFVGSYFVNSEEKCRKVLDEALFMDSLDECGKKCVENLKSTPLLLHLLCYLVKYRTRGDVASAWKLTDLYRKMSELLICVYIGKIKSNRKIDSFQNSLVSFGETAFKALVEKRIVFTEDEVISNEHGLLLVEMGYLKKSSSFCSDGSKFSEPTFYKPLHTSFLDYLSALYLNKLKDNPEEFASASTNLHNLLHSKSKTVTGANPSILIIFLCGLLKDKAHILFDKMFTPPLNGVMYNNFSDICLLLWHSGLTESNISAVVKSDRVPHEFQWLFNRNFQTESIDLQVFPRILAHPDCSRETLTVNNVNIISAFDETSKFGKLFPNDFCNTSIRNFEISLAPNSKTVPQLGSDVTIVAFRSFLNELPKFRNIETLTVQADIALDTEIHLSFSFLKKLMETVKYLPNLTKLLITANRIRNVAVWCDNFFGSNIGTDKVLSCGGKKKRKRIVDIEINTVLVEIFLKSLTEKKCFCELHLPNLNIKSDTLEELSQMVLEKEIKVLKFPYMKIYSSNDGCCSKLSPLMDVLSDPKCNLEELDLRGFNCNLEELDLRGFDCDQITFNSICLALESNKSLKRLNMSRLLTENMDLQPLFHALRRNKTLECLHISGNEIIVVRKPEQQTPEADEKDEKRVSNFIVNDNQLIELFSSFQHMTEVHLANWIFEIEQFQTVESIVNLIGKSKLSKLCLQKVKLKLGCFNGTDAELLEGNDKLFEIFKSLSLKLTHLDLRELTVGPLQKSNRRNLSVDSAYGSLSPSSPLDFEENESESESPVIVENWSNPFLKAISIPLKRKKKEAIPVEKTAQVDQIQMRSIKDILKVLKFSINEFPTLKVFFENCDLYK